jgi:hypothetical protein
MWYNVVGTRARVLFIYKLCFGLDLLISRIHLELQRVLLGHLQVQGALVLAVAGLHGCGPQAFGFGIAVLLGVILVSAGRNLQNPPQNLGQIHPRKVINCCIAQW